MKKMALFCLSLLAGCTVDPVIKEPTAIKSLRLTAAGSVEAQAVIDSRDRKPAWVRLYIVPAEYADEAQRSITMDGGKLGRWAMIPLVSISTQGQEPEPIRLAVSASTVHQGALMVLAIDPISPGRFAVSGVQIERRDADGEKG